MSQTSWYLSRASGIVAWALLTLSMVWGLLLSTRMFDRRPSPKGLVDLHRFLGGLSVVFVAVHVGTIVADTYVHFGWTEVLVPFASRWHRGAVAWGVVAFYLLIAVEVTSLFMRRLPRKLWHAVHFGSFGLFAMGTIHAFTAGHDRSNAAVQWSGLVIMSAFTFLALYRQVATKSKRVVVTRPIQPIDGAQA